MEILTAVVALEAVQGKREVAAATAASGRFAPAHTCYSNAVFSYML
jgi:hypothetical protein